MFYLSAAALAVFGLSQPVFADSGHLGAAKEHCNAMVTEGEKGLDHGGQGHTDVGVTHFKKMTQEGDDCLKHGQEAMKTSDGGKGAMGHFKEALMHAQS